MRDGYKVLTLAQKSIGILQSTSLPRVLNKMVFSQNNRRYGKVKIVISTMSVIKILFYEKKLKLKNIAHFIYIEA